MASCNTSEVTTTKNVSPTSKLSNVKTTASPTTSKVSTKTTGTPTTSRVNFVKSKSVSPTTLRVNFVENDAKQSPASQTSTTPPPFIIPTTSKVNIAKDEVEQPTTPTVSTTRPPSLTTQASTNQNSVCESKKKSRHEVMRVLEYDYHEMIPDMTVLTTRKKRDWDFHDPDVIRAIYIESETNALTKWRAEHAKIDMRKHSAQEIRPNRSYNLRLRLLRKKQAIEEKKTRLMEKMNDFERDVPQFDGTLRSNMTDELRRDFIRNQPAIPSHYMDHYAKWGKPPFKTHKKNKCH